jgi:7-cyano-7-deazaguanine synthase
MIDTSRDSGLEDRAALVLFSGGQDSTTCLAWALEQFLHVETVAFDYRQRHRIELDQRLVVLGEIRRRFPRWAGRLGDDHVVDLGVLGQISETSLTRDVAFAIEKSGLPNSFVPGRNLLFFTFAAAIAWRRSIRHLVGGMCETDYSGYPDCRDNSIKALQVALGLGMDKNFALHTPLMWLDKAATWSLAKDLGGDLLVKTIVEHTHTCYLSERGAQHDWGHGCGECPACKLRRRGYERWQRT